MTKPTHRPRGRPPPVPQDRDKLPDPISAGLRPDVRERPDRAIHAWRERQRIVGMTPLDVLINTMRKAWNAAEYMDTMIRTAKEAGPQNGLDDAYRDTINEWEGKMWALYDKASKSALRAAPFIHPKLIAVAHRKAPAPSKIDVSVLSLEERKMLLAAIRRGLIRPAAAEEGPDEIEGFAEDDNEPREE